MSMDPLEGFSPSTAYKNTLKTFPRTPDTVATLTLAPFQEPTLDRGLSGRFTTCNRGAK